MATGRNPVRRDAEREADFRQRLLRALAECLDERRYADVTIADIATRARTSKRTFYEHFQSKPDCLLSLFNASNARMVTTVRDEIAKGGPWQIRVERALGAYLEVLSHSPELLRTLFIEVFALGEPGISARRAATQEFARLVASMLDEVVAEHAGKSGLRPRAGAEEVEFACSALIGGVEELILVAIERGRVAELPQLTGPATRMFCAVLRDLAGS